MPEILLAVLFLAVSSVASAAEKSGGGEEAQWIQIFKSVGVPIVMLVWFMWKDKYQMQKIIALFEEIAKSMALWTKSNEDLSKEISGAHTIPPEFRKTRPKSKGGETQEEGETAKRGEK